MRCKTSVLLILLAATSCLAVGAEGQELDPGRLEPTPEVGLVGLSDGGAWTLPLKPGTRLTFQTMSATVPGALKSLSPNDKGDLVDEKTGQRYSMDDRPGGSASGYEEFTLVSANEKQAAFDHRIWQLSPTDGPGVTSAVSWPAIATPTQGIDYWTPPAHLAAMADQADGAYRVGRLEYKHGGKTYRALRVSTYETKVRSFRTYDLETGILLRLAIAGESGNSQKVGPDGRVSWAGPDMLLIDAQLANVRQVNIPWMTTQAPEKLKRCAGVQLQGETLFQMPAAPGSGVRQPMNLFMRFDSMEGDLITLDINGQKHPSFVAGYYIEPQLLARLSVGDVIDNDPVTRVRLSVAQKDAGRIVLREENPLQQVNAMFDLRSGLLAAGDRVQIIGGGSRQSMSFRTSFENLPGGR